VYLPSRPPRTPGGFVDSLLGSPRPNAPSPGAKVYASRARRVEPWHATGRWPRPGARTPCGPLAKVVHWQGITAGMHRGPSQLDPGVVEGDIIADKYRVEKVLGAGGMGVVVAARHVQLDERVALKFLRPEALGDEEAVARLVREARAAVKIKSEHVARVLDVGTLDSGAPYIVMEYLDGGDLAAWLKQRGALPIDQAIDFVLQAAVAVAEAHALGIVHRDLKPANLFCVRRADGQLSIKVLDFGISKLTDMAGAVSAMGMTKTGALMGSPLYMSPEQMRSSKDVGPETDIWALGIILFELIAGRPAFVGESVADLAIKISQEPIPSLRGLRPEIAAGLEAVVVKCLEKNPRRRYRNVGEVALALLPFAPKRAAASVERISGIIEAAGLSDSGRVVPPSSRGDETQAAGGTLPAVGRTTRGARARKSAVLGLGVLAMLAVAAGGTLAFLPKKGPAHLDTPQAPATEPAAAAARAAIVSLATPVVELPEPAPPTALVEPRALDVEPARPATQAPIVSPRSTAIPTKKKPAAGPPSVASSAAGPPAAAPPPAPPAAKANCNPPYVIDSAGLRQYKPECL
jgi:serine/threonine protein kinase